MAKVHMTPDGPKPCEASIKDCEYGASDHFTDEAEADREYASRGQKLIAEQGGVTKKKRKPAKAMSPREKELAGKNKELLQKIVDMRSETGDVTYEGADPVRAQRRLTESIEYANSRGNTNLANSLSSARVLPSGAFKTSDGKRVNTDAVLKSYVANKHIESERKAVIASMTEAAQADAPTKEKFSFKNEAGSFSASVSEGIDDDEFEKLSARQKKACSSPKEGFSLDKAREHLTPAQLHEVTSRQQVANYVVGKEPDVGQKDVRANRELKGKTTDEKMQSGLENLGSFYEQSAKTYGKSRDLKAHVSEGSDAMKSVAAKNKGNTFAPARSQKNGALVTERVAVNSAKARELLTADQLKKITTTTDKPDPEKARLALDEKTFGKIFKARKVSVRVTEAKG